MPRLRCAVAVAPGRPGRQYEVTARAISSMRGARTRGLRAECDPSKTATRCRVSDASGCHGARQSQQLSFRCIHIHVDRIKAQEARHSGSDRPQHAEEQAIGSRCWEYPHAWRSGHLGLSPVECETPRHHAPRHLTLMTQQPGHRGYTGWYPHIRGCKRET